MPPCAAIECARRGLSWKQKHFTRYPSSAMEAAAEAPASPDPTTITLYLRLLAGFTSLSSNRCRSHRDSMGPDGLFDFNSIDTCSEAETTPLPHQSEQDGQRHGNEATDQDPGK